MLSVSLSVAACLGASAGGGQASSALVVAEVLALQDSNGTICLCVASLSDTDTVEALWRLSPGLLLAAYRLGGPGSA